MIGGLLDLVTKGFSPQPASAPKTSSQSGFTGGITTRAPAPKKPPVRQSGSSTTPTFDIKAYSDSLKKQGLSDQQVQTSMYKKAKEQGLTSGLVDSQMGWGAGVTDGWLKQQGLGALGSAPSPTNATPQPLPSVRPAPSTSDQSGFVGGITTRQPTSGTVRAPTLPQPVTPNAPAASPTTGFNMKSYSDALKAQGLSDTQIQMGMYDMANRIGLSESEVDTQMGWAPGVTSGWLKQQGIGLLGTGQPPGQANWPSPGVVNNPVTGAQPNSSMYNFANRLDTSNPHSLMFTAPNLRQVNQLTDTVQGQLSQIQRADSDLMQLARTQGLEQAQKRGLLNSSLGVEAAQMAMLEKALPIAEQDAAAYMRQGLTNQEAENAFLGRVQGAAIEDWLGTKNDARAIEKLDAEFEQKRQLLSDEYGFKNDETAGKQNAALWAQFIQGAAEINKADMSVKDKEAQIEALKQSTLSGMASNAKQFNDPEMFTWIMEQMPAIDAAAIEAMNVNQGQAFTLPTGGPATSDMDREYRPGDTLPPGYRWGTDATGRLGIEFVGIGE